MFNGIKEAPPGLSPASASAQSSDSDSSLFPWMMENDTQIQMQEFTIFISKSQLYIGDISMKLADLDSI